VVFGLSGGKCREGFHTWFDARLSLVLHVHTCITVSKNPFFFFYVSSLEMETNFTPRDPNTSVREGTRDPKRQTTKNIRKHCKNEGSCARFRSCEQKEKNKGIIREHAGRKITV